MTPAREQIETALKAGPTPRFFSEAMRLDDDGILWWRVDRPLGHFSKNSDYDAYQTRYAGQPVKLTAKVGGHLRVSFRYMGVAYTRSAHRIVWAIVHGEWPNHEIDHIDCNPQNNRPSNLRDVTRAINSQNLKKPRSTNKLGVLGVFRRGKWFIGSVRHQGKDHHLGRFATIEQAHAAYLTKKRELHAGCTI